MNVSCIALTWKNMNWDTMNGHLHFVSKCFFFKKTTTQHVSFYRKNPNKSEIKKISIKIIKKKGVIRRGHEVALLFKLLGKNLIAADFVLKMKHLSVFPFYYSKLHLSWQLVDMSHDRTQRKRVKWDHFYGKIYNLLSIKQQAALIQNIRWIN